MSCWYCHWGWAKPVATIYFNAVEALNGNELPLQFGPAHVVWADENFDLAEHCLEKFDQFAGDYTPEELDIVRKSLLELAALPIEQRCIEPEDYDGNNVQDYPPSVEVVTLMEIYSTTDTIRKARGV